MSVSEARPFVSWSAPLRHVSPLSASDLEEFTQSLVAGLEVLERGADPRFSPASLGEEGFLCALCVAGQWDGLADPLLARTEHIREALQTHLQAMREAAGSRCGVALEDDVRCALLFELVSFRGRAWARKNCRERAVQEWAGLEGEPVAFLESTDVFPWARRGLRAARGKAEVERGVMALNQGHYGRALAHIEAVLDADVLHDVAAELRGLSVCELACIGLGEAPKLKAFFARESRILEGVLDKASGALDAFRRTRARREITALISQEAFLEAEAALERTLVEMKGQDDLLEALLRQQKIQLHLIRDDCASAEAELRELEAFAGDRSFPAATFDLSPQRYELALRQKKHDKLGEELQRGLTKALERDDVSARMSASVFMARWQLLAGLHDEARASILSALKICEDEGYGPHGVDCLFHAMGVAHTTRDVRLFRESALKAGRLARKLGLSIKAACFEYILSLTSPARERSALPLLELLRVPRVGKEAYFFLDYYGFLKGMRFEVRSAQDPTQCALLDERDLRESVLRGNGAWWFEDAGVLLAVRDAGTPAVSVASVELAKGSLLRAAFEALIASREGLTTEDVHALTSEAQYHPLRHASKVKTLLHRLRGVLEPVGLSLPSARGGGRYVLEGLSSLACVQGPLSEEARA